MSQISSLDVAMAVILAPGQDLEDANSASNTRLGGGGSCSVCKLWRGGNQWHPSVGKSTGNFSQSYKGKSTSGQNLSYGIIQTKISKQ